MPRKYHWPTIKAEYVEGIVNDDGNRSWLSLEETALKFGCSVTYIRKKSTKGGWLAERHIFVDKVAQAIKEKKSDRLAGKAANFDIKCLKVANAGISHIAHHFKVAADAGKPLSLTESNLAAQALKNFQAVGRLALGESTEKTDNMNPIINLSLTKIDVASH